MENIDIDIDKDILENIDIDINIDKEILENIDIDIDIDKDILENIDIDIDIDKEILENIDIDIDIDKEILENIDIDKISNRLEFGISNRATRVWVPHHCVLCLLCHLCVCIHISCNLEYQKIQDKFNQKVLEKESFTLKVLALN